MEPVRRGRDDPPVALVGGQRLRAAMEPVRRGRDDLNARQERAIIAEPQWSPSGEDGTTLAGWLDEAEKERAPQWSPSGEDGTTHVVENTTRIVQSAAMEPVRRGRDDPKRPIMLGHQQTAAMEPVRRGRDDATGRHDLR